MNYNKKTLNDIKVDNKKVIVRVDFNVPIKDGKITDDKRIKAALPTIKHLIDKKCKIVLLSHLSRIKSLDDIKSNKKSLKVVYEDLKNKLPNTKIIFHENNVDPNLVSIVNNLEEGSIILLENTRYQDVNANGEVVKLESKNNPELGKFWASLGEVFVNDAFGTAHRAHASNVGIASNIKESCLGFLVQKEIEMLNKALTNPEKPVVAIFGGAKISDKIKSIENIGKIADKILIGGGMAFTFFKAKGYEIGKSLVEEESLPIAKELLTKYADKIVLPLDSRCSTAFENNAPKIFTNEQFEKDYMGLDIGDKTIEEFKNIIQKAKTVIWNGPLGVCEFSHYEVGTLKVCESIANATVNNKAFTIIGGGDSAAAAIKLGFEEKFTHISTGGGASLEFFEGKELPGIASIQNK